MGKCYGFSKEEFSVICDVFHITSLVCFETEEADTKEQNIVEGYYRVLFELYKKGYLILSETDFILSKEVKQIFSLLEKCENVITISAKDDNLPGYCIYNSTENDMLLMRSGSRQGEYVKIELLQKDDFSTFIKEAEILLPETVWEDYPVALAQSEVIGEQIVDFMENGCIEKAEALWEIPQVITLFRVLNPKNGRKKSYLAVVKQPIQDKIIVVEEDCVQIITYSEKKMLELLQKIQEKENGIGGCDCTQCE